MKRFSFGVSFLALLGIFLLSPLKPKAQEGSTQSSSWLQNGWIINVNGGLNLFYGDMRQYEYWPVSKYESERKFAFGLILGKQLTSFLDWRGQLLYGDLAGTKRKMKSGSILNQYFNAKMFEYSMSLKLDLTSLIMGADDDRFANIYTYVGMGLVDFRTQLKNLGSNVDVMSYGYDNQGKKTKATTEAVFPVGVGVDFKLAQNLKANIDYSMRFVNTDKIDGYVNHKSGIDDMYGYSSIGITYILNFGKKASSNVEYVQAPKEPEPVVEAPKEDTVAAIADSVASVDSSANVQTSATAPEKAQIQEQTPAVDSVIVSKTVHQDSVKIEEPKAVVTPKVETITAPVAKTVKQATSAPKQTPKPAALKTPKVTPSVDIIQTATKGLQYRVQIMALKEKGQMKVAKLKLVYNIQVRIFEEYADGWYKYTAGEFATLEEAQILKASLQKRGRTDVFLVAYNDGKRIPIKDALQLQGK